MSAGNFLLLLTNGEWTWPRASRNHLTVKGGGGEGLDREGGSSRASPTTPLSTIQAPTCSRGLPRLKD